MIAFTDTSVKYDPVAYDKWLTTLPEDTHDGYAYMIRRQQMIADAKEDERG